MQRDALLLAASRHMWALSGRRWSGSRTVAAEVIADGVSPGWNPSWGEHVPLVAPYTTGDGEIRNCFCARPPAVRLPGDNITAVDSVTVNGAARDPATYRLAHGWLEDRSGAGWPTCEPGMIVTYRLGTAPPADGTAAVAELAAELIRSVAGQETRLPGNVTSITRQGITVGQVPASALYEKGMTGIAPVDAWLATVNPNRLTRSARSWSPDTAVRAYPLETP